MTWLFAVVALVVLAATFLAVLGLLGDLPPAEPDLRPDELQGEPVFDVVVRGYRMEEVDARIGALEAELEQLRGGVESVASGDDAAITETH